MDIKEAMESLKEMIKILKEEDQWSPELEEENTKHERLQLWLMVRKIERERKRHDLRKPDQETM